MARLPSFNTLLFIPVVSYFLFPTSATSWTMSLNLLLFSLTWTTITWSQPPLLIELTTTFVVRLLFYIVPSILFLAFDLLLPSLSKSLKSKGRNALPASAANASSTSPYPRLARIVGLSLLNTLLSGALQMSIELLLTEVFRTRSALKISARLPAPWTIARDVLRGLLLRGLLSYYIHRHILHSRNRSLRQLTRLHGEYYHSLSTCLPFAAGYDHPLPYLLHRWIPLYFPAYLMRIHVLTFSVMSALVCLEEALVYSGYSVIPPSTTLLAGVARRHEGHVESGGEGCYGCYGVMDWVHGSGVKGEDDVGDDVGKEVEKRDLDGKAKRAQRSVRGKGRKAFGQGDGADYEDEEYEDDDGADENVFGRAGKKMTDSVRSKPGRKSARK